MKGKRAMPKTLRTDEEPTGKAIRLIDKTVLTTFHGAASALSSKISKFSGDLGKLTAEAAKKHLHKKAYGVIAWALKRVGDDPDGVAAFKAHLDDMWEKFELDDKCNLQGRLFVRGDDEPESASEDDKDLRPRHLRQPNASGAAAAVQDLAKASGAKTSTDPIEQVGRGKPN